MRTVFFGTPGFSVPTLAALVAAGLAPERVVTQPARPVGRGHRLQDSPVARWAHRHDLAVLQPEKVNRRSFRDELRAAAPDVAVVVAFGQIFRRRLLALPRLGCLNLHASLLPSYRGAAPIQAAIVAGEKTTGVTTMQMTEGLDSGPILLREELTIGPDETSPHLAERLAERGAKLMVRTLEALAKGDLAPTPQDESQASHAPQLSKAQGLVDWRLSAREIFNRLRAFTPWPGQSGRLSDTSVKLLWGCPQEGPAGAEPGTILGLREERLAVACGDDTILGLERVQLPGRRPISARDFVNGQQLQAGERFA